MKIKNWRRHYPIDLLHKSKKLSGFLGETKPVTFAYTDVREERRRVSTTKSPTRLTYAVSLISAGAHVLYVRLAPRLGNSCYYHDFDSIVYQFFIYEQYTLRNYYKQPTYVSNKRIAVNL
ncbi:hypothetical protein [Candidatus Tisiphia endosymbiont of Ptychoptera albimana]|uniref:hypothetical protein n=1 Tax=Candidatus Tisiphia endosymbiont of Ptychoptera albimana TaxID=3066260 RepID=UPI00312CAD59